MSLFLLVNAIALISLWTIYHYLIYPVFISPLSSIPNAHPTSSCLSVWIWWKRRTGRETRSIFAAHQRHGPIIRLGPKEVSVASLDGLRRIYGAGFERVPWYDQFMNYGTRSLFTLRQSKSHARRKRMLSNVYSKSYLQTSRDLQLLSSVLLSERLLPALEAAAQSSSPINVLELFEAAGADFTSAYLLGLTSSTNFVGGDASDFTRYFRLSRAKIQDPADIGTKELEARYVSWCQTAENFLQRACDKPASSVPATYPVVYAKLAAELSKDSSSHPPTTSLIETVACEMMDQILAGQENIGNALTYLAYELSQRPALQAALRDECLTLSPPLTFPLHFQSTGNPNSGLPDNPALAREDGVCTQPRPLPSPSSIDALPLLHAILYETLRLYQGVPSPQPRVVPAGGATIEGIANIPAGTTVSASAFCLHRNEEVWPEAETWRPERWMDRGAKGYDEMKRWFWAFGSGGRMCLGSHFAVQTLKLLTAAIYTSFTTSIVDDDGIEQADSFIAGPIGQKLILRFHPAATHETT